MKYIKEWYIKQGIKLGVYDYLLSELGEDGIDEMIRKFYLIEV